MFLLLHIGIALISIGQSTLLLFSPSKKKLTSNYVLFGFTVASGTYLIVSKPAHMMQTCIEGLLYMAFVLIGIVVARRKLAAKIAQETL